MKDDIKGGAGICKHCKEYVNNVALHQELCKKPDPTCKICKGSGRLYDGQVPLRQDHVSFIKCPHCKGKGKHESKIG